MTRTVFILFKRQCIDSSRNYWMWSMVMLPLLYAFLFGQSPELHVMAAVVSIFMAHVFTGVSIHSGLIAEEKEKSTLSVYRVSPFGHTHLLIAKSLFSLFVNIVISLVILLISSSSVHYFFLCISVIILSSIFFILVGTIVGFYSKNTIDISVKMVPAILVFLIFPIFSPIIKNDFFEMINAVLPGLSILNGLAVAISGEGGEIMMKELGVLIGWIILLFVSCIIIYKKRKSL
jgi:ABC-2 type transport system permease protein